MLIPDQERLKIGFQHLGDIHIRLVLFQLSADFENVLVNRRTLLPEVENLGSSLQTLEILVVDILWRPQVNDVALSQREGKPERQLHLRVSGDVLLCSDFLRAELLLVGVKGNMRVLLVDSGQVAKISRIGLESGADNIIFGKNVINVPVVRLVLIRARCDRLAAGP